MPVDTLRQVPCYSAGASFLQCFVLCSFLKSWSTRIALMSFTLLDTPRDGPFLSRNFMWCQVLLENLTACFDPNFPWFTLNRLSRIRILRYTTHLCRLLQFCNGSFFFFFLGLFAGLLLGLNMSEETFSSTNASGSQTCSFDPREDANIYMTVFYSFGNGTEFRSFCQQSFPLCCLMWFEDISPSPSVLAFEDGAREDDRPFRL